jgi:chromosome segregation ATPase
MPAIDDVLNSARKVSEAKEQLDFLQARKQALQDELSDLNARIAAAQAARDDAKNALKAAAAAWS